MELGGKAAVACFLLISGLSIGYSYKKSSVGYLQRRFLRIYPLYFFSILVTVFLQYFLGSPYHLPGVEMKSAGIITSIGNFFFLQGFLTIAIPYNGVVWTLAIEFFYYLLAPLLIKLSNTIIHILIITSILCFTLLNHPSLYGYNALIYAWAWLIGFFISAQSQTLFSLIYLGFGTIAIYLNKHIMSESLSFITFASFSLVSVLSIYSNFKLYSFLKNWFNYMGELSYPLYLFHMPLFLIFYYLGVRSSWVFLLLLLILIVPINFVFDKKLKQIYWKPIILYINSKIASNVYN
jgi:peptidoglycan/LPS O-acetylase OafA/YrhL